jgi:hypothetical protein
MLLLSPSGPTGAGTLVYMPSYPLFICLASYSFGGVDNNEEEEKRDCPAFSILISVSSYLTFPS